ncbi:MAG: glutaredoxin family protein [Alphaproteobacteria bacterium]|nr:glutaredoxin family protein [Alphaproteobacteria bacterium]
MPGSDRTVVIYKTQRCPYCVAASRYLREIKHVGDADIGEIDLTNDHEARFELARRSGQRTVPQIWIHGHHVGGYDDLRALDANGELDPLLGR